jgi:MFS family permease
MPYGHLRHLVEHYVAPHPARELKTLFVSRLFLTFSASCVSLFQAVYLYRQGFSPALIIALYGAAYFLYLVGLPLTARICRRHGYEQTMLISAPFLIIHNLAFMLVPTQPVYGAVLLVAGLTGYKLFYWPSFHACFATWCNTEEDGREISNLDALSTIVRVSGPAIGGGIIAWLGFPALFAFSTVLILISFAPLLRVPTIIMPQTFSYLGAWRRLFRRETWRTAVGSMALGMDVVMVAVWPVFVTVKIAGVAVIGALASLAEALNTLILLEAGRRTDESRGARSVMLKLGTAGAAVTFAIRGLLTNGLGVFGINLFYSLSTHLLAVPYTADVYEDAKRGDVMERIVFMEMALNSGRVLLAVAVALILAIAPGAWTAAFAVTGVFVLLALVLPVGKK